MSINLTYTAFTKGIDDVRAAVALIEKDKSRIDTRVGGFLGSGWTGVAADSFVDAWDDWKVAADEVQQALEGMGELLDATLKDFTARDDASQQSLDRVSARIIDRLG